MRCLRNISVYHMPRLKNLENSLVSLNLLIFKLVSFVTIVGLIGAAGQDNTLLTHSTYPNLEIGPSNTNYLIMANLGAKPLGEEEQDHDDNSQFKIIQSRNSTTSPIVPINQINHQQSSITTAVQISHPYKSTLESNNHNHTKELTITTTTNSNQTFNINSYQQFGDIHLQRAGITGSKRSRRSKRSVVHLYDMVVCATGCNPLAYKGYGCYCGFLGSGLTVDGIDRCCAKHDFCYHLAKCPQLLTYFVPYYWTCNDGRPNCVSDYRGWKGVCGAHLCECDRQFAECLRKFPCPRARAMCVTSPFRYPPEPETYYYYP